MIKRNELKAIDDYSKFFINQGIYFLYSIEHKSAHYLLKVDNEFFLLDNIGNIVQKAENFEQHTIIESIYFSDIKRPPISNSIKIA